MLLMPLAADAHLSVKMEEAHLSASDASRFDASIPGEKMTLQQCFQLADRQNLALQSGRKAVEKAQVMQGTAWDLDKTEIAFSQNPASSGDTDNGLTFSQSIEFPTVYTARRNQLKAETQAEKSRLNVTSQQLRLEIASAYYAMLYQTHRLQILLQQDSVIQRYCDVAAKRYRAGEARQLEFLSADRMRNDNRLEMTKVKNEAENLQTALMALLNTTTPVVPDGNLLISQRSPVNAAFNYQQTADAQYQKDLITALDKEVKCAKTGYAPSLSLALRSQLLIDSWDPYHINRQRFTEGNFFGFEYRGRAYLLRSHQGEGEGGTERPRDGADGDAAGAVRKGARLPAGIPPIAECQPAHGVLQRREPGEGQRYRTTQHAGV